MLEAYIRFEAGEPPKPGKPGTKEKDKVVTKATQKSNAPSDCGCPEADMDEGYYKEKTRYWYTGNLDREAKADWYGEDEYNLITQDWENGQVMQPMSLWEQFPIYTEGARSWHGWGVDSRGYLTGERPAPEFGVLVGGFGGGSAKAAAGFNLLLNGTKPKPVWSIYIGLKTIAGQGGQLFLYIGKAKNGIAARYSASKLSQYQIQALKLLNKIPDNGTALGIEQHVMNLNGWINKAENAARPVLANKNAAAIKDIYLEQGLKWLNSNVPDWRTAYKFQ